MKDLIITILPYILAIHIVVGFGFLTLLIVSESLHGEEKRELGIAKMTIWHGLACFFLWELAFLLPVREKDREELQKVREHFNL